MRKLFLLLCLAIGLVGACAQGTTPRDLPARLAAANLMAGSLASGLAQATASGVIEPGSATSMAVLVTLDAVELALDGAGDAWRAGLPDLADRNLDAAEGQMAGLGPLLGQTPQGE